MLCALVFAAMSLPAGLPDEAPGARGPAPGAVAADDHAAPVDEETAALLRSPWTEDLGLVAVELAGATCGGLALAPFHLVLTYATCGCWSGVVLPLILGYSVGVTHNLNTTWQSAALWPMLGAVAVSATWTLVVTAVSIALLFPLTAAQGGSNSGLPIPPRADAVARLALPGVFGAAVFSLMLSPLLSMMGAITAYNITAEVGAEDSTTPLVPEVWPWDPPPDAARPRGTAGRAVEATRY